MGDGQSHGPPLKQGWWWFTRKLCPTLATTWTVAHQAPLSMGFSRQEYWSGLPFPSLGDLPDPGIEPRSPVLQADSLPTELRGKPLKQENHSKKQGGCERRCKIGSHNVPSLFLSCFLLSQGFKTRHILSAQKVLDDFTF